MNRKQHRAAARATRRAPTHHTRFTLTDDPEYAWQIATISMETSRVEAATYTGLDAADRLTRWAHAVYAGMNGQRMPDREALASPAQIRALGPATRWDQRMLPDSPPRYEYTLRAPARIFGMATGVYEGKTASSVIRRFCESWLGGLPPTPADQVEPVLDPFAIAEEIRAFRAATEDPKSWSRIRPEAAAVVLDAIRQSPVINERGDRLVPIQPSDSRPKELYLADRQVLVLYECLSPATGYRMRWLSCSRRTSGRPDTMATADVEILRALFDIAQEGVIGPLSTVSPIVHMRITEPIAES